MKENLWPILHNIQRHKSHGSFRQVIHHCLEKPLRDWQDYEEMISAFMPQFRSVFQNEIKSPLGYREFEKCVSKGYQCITPCDHEYPEKFKHCSDPPLTLTVYGSINALQQPILSVVGSREPSFETLSWMESELSLFCQKNNVVIASGGARGVDQKAHSVAIKNKTPTLIFLPSGIENSYPQMISSWFPLVVEQGGGVVSEYPLAMEMRKQAFYHRNRLIAAIGNAVLVTESRESGGSMITASRAAEIGRPLFTLPAHPQDSRYRGNLFLLRESATLICQHEELSDYWRADCL